MKALIKVATAVVLVSVAVTAQNASRSKPASVKKPPTFVSAPTGRAVVRVNGSVLTDRDLLRQMMIQFPYARQHGGFPKEMESDIQRDALREIEFDELVYQDALRRKMTVAGPRLEKAVRDFRKQFESDQQYQQFLQTEVQGSTALLREKVKRAILIEDLLKIELVNKAHVSPVEARAFYNKERERFRRPESVSLQTISLVIPDNPTAKQKSDVRKRAEDALRQAKATRSFEEFGLLAEKISEDDWRVMMGDHKSLHRGRMPPPVEKVAFGMRPGEVSGIIETENSFCIARVYAREEAKLMPFETVRAGLTKDLESQKKETLRATYEAKLRKGAKIEEL